MSTRVNFSNSWLGLLGWKHPIWKNHKVQFPINQILKNESEKKNSTIQKDSKQKISIKGMRIKTKIKTKLEEKYKKVIEW
jgi:hypothetical protein